MNITRVPSGNGNVLVVDSRLVADRLGIRHDNLVQTIEKYKTQAEQAFGLFLFQTETRKRAVGATVIRYYLLTEDQATFIMSLSRNTPEVVQCKLELVQAFSKAKALLQTPTFTYAWTERLKLFRRKTKIPTGWFCIFEELNNSLVGDLEDHGIILPGNAVPDISVGKCFCKHLRATGRNTDDPGLIRKYRHFYPDGRIVDANIYVDKLLPEYRQWFNVTYRPDKFVTYLKGKDPSLLPTYAAILGLPEGSL